MKIGLVFGKLSFIASATSLVALVQIAMSSCVRSSLVIRPRSYCFWTFSSCASYPLTISFFASGTTTSEMATVTPERVAQ
jgi:hypothetical protein